MEKPRKPWQAARALAQDNGFALFFGEKASKTPGGRPFLLPTESLAAHVAAEWRAQCDKIEPATMPLTQLCATAIDRVAPERAEVIAGLMQYASTDLLCYRAAHPKELQERQAQSWQPLLNWLEQRHGARLLTTDGIAVIEQPAESLAPLERHLQSLDDFRLAGVIWAAQIMGSLTLAFALLHRRVDAEACFALAELDALWQQERWGEDSEAAARFVNMRRELDDAARFLQLL